MQETAEELQRLDALLERSGRQARSKMLRRIFPYPEKSLNARQLSRLLAGTRQVALATGDRNGAPRVAPVDALFFHGRFYFSTDRSTARARDIVRRPELSLTYFEGEDLAIIVHGRALSLRPEDTESTAIDNVMKNLIGMGIVEVTKQFGGDEGLWFRVDPRVMFTFAREPQRFPE